MADIDALDTEGPNIRVLYLNRYADEVVDGYRENIDQAECALGAQSLSGYVAKVAEDASIEVKISVEENVVSIDHPSGRSLEVTVFDYEAMDAVYTPLPDDEGLLSTPLMVLFPELDRSGTSYLVEQIVEHGFIDIPDADDETGSESTE
ncbi:hypothetical protein C8N35_104189 [Breoghania corrubedonensis]|uniref:Uncharacterized protein n=1 Tax=Breoghania corrubedonensis TaxID=665038 RepID=A0A2T5VA02_9HYPH|nr:hypothetical protein [Breoghania corrubedonensis]PTW60564.1 hypothetical protein C8N35_104189 [Breoghania corrubedonensis]